MVFAGSPETYNYFFLFFTHTFLVSIFHNKGLNKAAASMEYSMVK